MKVIALYLPQFHKVKENDIWWGEGFTEWVNVKKAKPLFEGHYQPRIPLNENYYDLLNIEVLRWQCCLAKKYGIYGFCFYHYWFDGKMLLERPVENYLHDKECNLPFCMSWANENWTNVWNAEKGDTRILISQNYGDKRMWRRHFEYLLPFFRDERYIKIDGKPIFVIYKPHHIPSLKDMLELWNILAANNGLSKICFIYQHLDYDEQYGKKDKIFEYAMEYQPGYGYRDMESPIMRGMKNVKHKIDDIFIRNGRRVVDFHQSIASDMPKLIDYDAVWESILRKKVTSDTKYLPGAFVDWDNTPRRGNAGTVYIGATPEKFKSYFRRLVRKARDEYCKDMIFIFAWNEWAEGGYLEPDEKNGYSYLEAIRDSLIAEDEISET